MSTSKIGERKNPERRIMIQNFRFDTFDTYVDFEIDRQLKEWQRVQCRVRSVSLSGDIGRRNGQESDHEGSVEEHGPDDRSKKVIELGKEQVVQLVARARNVTHVRKEHEPVPKVVRFVHQFANLWSEQFFVTFDTFGGHVTSLCSK